MFKKCSYFSVYILILWLSVALFVGVMPVGITVTKRTTDGQRVTFWKGRATPEKPVSLQFTWNHPSRSLYCSFLQVHVRIYFFFLSSNCMCSLGLWVRTLRLLYVSPNLHTGSHYKNNVSVVKTVNTCTCTSGSHSDANHNKCVPCVIWGLRLKAVRSKLQTSGQSHYVNSYQYDAPTMIQGWRHERNETDSKQNRNPDIQHCKNRSSNTPHKVANRAWSIFSRSNANVSQTLGKKHHSYPTP